MANDLAGQLFFDVGRAVSDDNSASLGHRNVIVRSNAWDLVLNCVFSRESGRTSYTLLMKSCA